MKEFVISHRQEGQRLDKYLCKLLDRAPRGFVYKMLRKKNIVLNSRKASGAEKLSEGDIVRIWLADETFAKFCSRADNSAHAGQEGKKTADPASARAIFVVYEDDDILIVNKPAGVLSQKAKASDDSMNERIIDYLLQSGALSARDLIDFKPSVCNRLDRNTSGLLLAGKTIAGMQELSSLLQTRDLKKYYRCIAAGNLTEEMHLRGWLTKDAKQNRSRITETPIQQGSQPAATDIRPLEQFADACYLEAALLTGRSHQIRAHLASVGHPLIGDVKYGGKDSAVPAGMHAARPLLHAYRMEFPDGRVFCADLPEDFEAALRAYRSRSGRQAPGDIREN